MAYVRKQNRTPGLAGFLNDHDIDNYPSALFEYDSREAAVKMQHSAGAAAMRPTATRRALRVSCKSGTIVWADGTISFVTKVTKLASAE